MDADDKKDLPYFSVQAKKSQEQSAMLEASAPLDGDGNDAHDYFGADDGVHIILMKCSKLGGQLDDDHLNEENVDGMLREVQSP